MLASDLIGFALVCIRFMKANDGGLSTGWPWLLEMASRFVLNVGKGGVGMSEYWKIAVEEALDCAGITTSLEQRAELAKAMKMSHEMYSEASGEMYIPNPLQEENRQLRKQLEYERQLISCKTCGGTGREEGYVGVSHRYNMECCKCHGEGKVSK